jgi:signal transduction histidine kinase
MHTILLITGILMIFGLCFGLILYRLLPFNAVIQAMNEAQNANNDLIKIMEELKKKNADIEQFLYTASHDLRTPLVTVKNFLGFLENDISKGDQRIVLEDLQYLHGAADKMKQILDELLEISRIEHAGAPMVKLSFLELLTDVLNVMRGTILEWEVNIIMPQSDLMLIGDRSHLFRIWQNLIENAIKYCREDCNILIELGVWHHSNETVFFVKDNGIGIDHQYQNKIFGIFEQLNQNSPGTGMGLYMIQRIVNNYNGRIWVESEGIGKGSCFFFTLPKVIFQT